MSSLPLLYRKLRERGFFGKPKNRWLLEEALEIISKQVVSDSPSLTFVQLPPGYGKTAIPFSLALWAIQSEEIPIERSIHVLPLRAIVEDVSVRFTGYGRNIDDKPVGLRALEIPKEEAENIAGAQCMSIHGSPFLQKEGFISTTLDTFTLLACKLPTHEISKIARGEQKLYGHYEIARGAILSSIIIFDEAHLFFEEHEGLGRASQALIALMVALLKWRVPIIMMTATLPDSLRKEIMAWINDYVPEKRFNIFEYNGEGKVDQDFEDEVHSVNLETKIEKDENKYIDSIRQACDSYNRVLVVANTISRSIDLFNKLRSKGVEPILLHSKFTQKDRKSKLDELKKNKWICISTQVIEAGVDISSDVLFTDIAPVCSIIQRAGRCCRPSHTYSKAGKIVICTSKESMNAAESIYDRSKIEATYKELASIDKAFYWHSYLHYFPLINKIYNEEPDFKFGYAFTSILNIFEKPYYESRDALEYLLELGSFTRDSPLIPTIVCEKGEIDKLGDLNEKLDSSIPLEKKDLEKICRKSEVMALRVKESNKIEEEPVNKRMIKSITTDIILSKISALRIPKEIYDEKCGLKMYEECDFKL